MSLIVPSVGAIEEAGSSGTTKTIATVRTVRISVANSSHSSVNPRVELDNHADTTVLGKQCLKVHDFGRPVKVTGYDPSDGTKTCSTIAGVVAYDHPQTGKTYHLVFNQAIHAPHLDHHLLCPMQCRLNDVKIDETPKFLVNDPDEFTHAIAVGDPSDEEDPLIIPLLINGVTSYFPVRVPTVSEWENEDITRIDMTCESPEWDPSCSSFAEREESMMDFRGNVIERMPAARGQRFISDVSVSNAAALAIDPSADGGGISLGNALESNVNAISMVGVANSKASKMIDHMSLSRKWGISPAAAKRTVQRTTQRGIRTVLHPSLSRRFRTNDRALRYRRLPHDVFGDTLIAGTKSRRGNKYAEVFSTPFGWARAFPMKKKSEAHEALSLLFTRDGVPNTIITDGSKEQVEGEFKRKAKEAGCRVKQTEPHSPWQNNAEVCIRELKISAGRAMTKARSPKKLWDDCIELQAYIRSNTAHDIFVLNGEVPETIMSGETSDISQFCEFEWYQWLKFRDTAVSYPDDKVILGRYLGPSIDIGPALTAKILKSNGEVVHRSTYRALTPEEIESEEEQAARKEFDAAIAIKLGPQATKQDFEELGVEDAPVHEPYEDDDAAGVMPAAPPEEEEPTPDGAPDNYLSASVMLPRGDSLARGRVVGRKRDADGNPLGRANANPILDTRRYEVEFADGEVTELTANVIAQSMFAQCDEEGNDLLLLESMVDYRKSEKALSIKDQKIVHRGRPSLRRTTVGWQICVQWKDGSTSWEKLSDLKECYPVETAEYATAQGIDHEPAFNWWVPHVLKRRDRIISAVKRRGNTRYMKRTHKFGIEVPKTIKEAYALDAKNGNTLWADAIAKEAKSVRPGIKVLAEEEDPPPGHQRIRCHWIFDIKMEDFRRKARYVAGGHMTEPPASITYASVVSRETVRIALTIAALNDLDVKMADIQNAYIKAPVSEKVYTILGEEWGPDAGKTAVIVRSLYGLKSSGASFRNHLADCMRHLGYTPCAADPDLWLKPMVRPSDGLEYYSYVLCYVDDVLAIGHDAEDVLKKIDKYFGLKPGSLGDPKQYLGAKLRKMRMSNGVWAWAFSPSQYVQESVRNVEKYIADNLHDRWKLPKRAENPFEMGYAPELDDTPCLNPSLASYYQSQIGVLRWMVELGRVDINTEVSMLSSQLAMPREGHLEALLHIFAFLKAKHNSRLALDPTYPDIDYSVFKQCDWKEFYGDAKEAIPSDAPEPRGKEVDLRLYVDSDHAGDKQTRRSRTGFFIFMNTALINWLSKKQATIETSVFGAEFVAMKHGMETLRGIRYKLRMMGVPISGPSFIYGDNMSVIHNTQRPESTLKKKSNSICYHAVRESVAMNESLTGHCPTDDNPADLNTKVLYGRKRRKFVSMLLYDIYDDHVER